MSGRLDGGPNEAKRSDFRLHDAGRLDHGPCKAGRSVGRLHEAKRSVCQFHKAGRSVGQFHKAGRFDGAIAAFRRDLPAIIAGRDPLARRLAPPRIRRHRRQGADGLTDKQRTLMRYIQRYADVHGEPPLVVEMSAHCGVVSVSSTLEGLEAKGWIRRGAQPMRARGLTVLKRLIDQAETAEQTHG